MASNKKRGKTPSGTSILFVYGTLRRGQRNHCLMRKARFLGEAVTVPEYTLLDLGSFPGMVPGGTTAVHGELYEVGPELLARLDRHEGVPRFYQRETIHLANCCNGSSYLFVDDERISKGSCLRSGIWGQERSPDS